MDMKGRLGVIASTLFLVVLLVACGQFSESKRETEPPKEPPPVTAPPVEHEPAEPEPPVAPEPPPEISPAAPTRYYLSDLRWESAKNGYGPFALTLTGKTYAKGLGVTAPSELIYSLGGRCSSFSAEVGIDDLSITTGSTVTDKIIFQVYADNVNVWDSGSLTASDAPKATGQLDLTGRLELKLVVVAESEPSSPSHQPSPDKHHSADWADALMTCDPAPPALATGDASLKGSFGAPQSWPTIPTHASLLPDSTILSWYSRDTDGATRGLDYNDQTKHNHTIVDSWDTNTGQHTRLDNLTTDLFCAGFTTSADGRLLVAGGNLGSRDGNFYPGSRHINIFDPLAKTWSRGPDMTEGRWYPSVLSLPNKEVLIAGGNSNTTTHFNYLADVWNPTTTTLRRLTNASTQRRDFQHTYPWLHVAPNGQVFYTGSTTQMAYLDTSGKGSWSSTYTRDTKERFYGSSVMYEPGKVLVMGGGGNTTTAVTIDLTNGVQAAPTDSMTYGRTNLNATLLADGQVFVNGGNTSGLNFDDSTSVYSSEIWNPATGTWQLAATAQKPRNYHAVSLLLPDGRVWTAGGGGCGGCAVNQQSTEIFYPPYLFKKDGSGLLADRPRVTSASSTMTYKQTYTLYSPTPATIQKAALAALGSVTHAFNMNQHYVPLTITSENSTSLTVTAPSNANLAPPGYYMLFVIDNNGVPSVGRIVHVQ
jgi:Domain of unknown function (DUF1929)/NPCBM/NEW2 domain/Glyoxal oxidase N-terminus